MTTPVDDQQLLSTEGMASPEYSWSGRFDTVSDLKTVFKYFLTIPWDERPSYVTVAAIKDDVEYQFPERNKAEQLKEALKRLDGDAQATFEHNTKIYIAYQDAVNTRLRQIGKRLDSILSEHTSDENYQLLQSIEKFIFGTFEHVKSTRIAEVEEKILEAYSGKYKLMRNSNIRARTNKRNKNAAETLKTSVDNVLGKLKQLKPSVDSLKDYVKENCDMRTTPFTCAMNYKKNKESKISIVESFISELGNILAKPLLNVEKREEVGKIKEELQKLVNDIETKHKEAADLYVSLSQFYFSYHNSILYTRVNKGESKSGKFKTPQPFPGDILGYMSKQEPNGITSIQLLESTLFTSKPRRLKILYGNGNTDYFYFKYDNVIGPLKDPLNSLMEYMIKNKFVGLPKAGGSRGSRRKRSANRMTRKR